MKGWGMVLFENSLPSLLDILQYDSIFPYTVSYHLYSELPTRDAYILRYNLIMWGYGPIQTQNQTKFYEGLGFLTRDELGGAQRVTVWKTSSFEKKSQNRNQVLNCRKNHSNTVSL
jgi:hypothetical protein